MNVKRIALSAMVMGALVLPMAMAAQSSLTITADQLSYDGKAGKATAKGSVVITKDDKTMVGAEGWYDVNRGEAFLTGGVSMIGNNMSMAAGEVHTYDNQDVSATGSVRLQKDDRQIFGDSVRYNTSSGYGVIEGNGRLVVEDNVITGNRIEAWTNAIEAVAEGNVTLHSSSRNIDGSADRAVYTQTPGENDGVARLIGNAYAVQNGNILNAPELRLELKDNSAETFGGRSTLVITPK